jgi:hypothetical protein
LIFQDRRRNGQLDLEAVEMALRSALHQAGAAALSKLLRCDPPAAEQRGRACPCGQTAHYRELRSRHILTVLGEVKIDRPYFLCAGCGKGQFPFDVELDVEDKELSPGVRRMLALVGAEASFGHGRQQMELLAGLEVTAKAVERTAESIGEDLVRRECVQVERAAQLHLPVVIGPPIPVLYMELDGTGIPVVKKETVGRIGKVAGQPAHTREAKLGCVFTQSGWDEEGYPIRDPDSTSYVGAVETADQFGKRIYLEAWNRGWARAATKVVIGDGAEWIWNDADIYLPGAIQIVDLYHAREHLWDLARHFHPYDKAGQQSWMNIYKPKLDGGEIEELVRLLRAIKPATPELAEGIRTETGYFERNSNRMRYPLFRAQHLFVGSGVIEAGCKTVIGQRLKQSGMFWTIRGANAIIALRCCHLNGNFESYWENRRAA